MPVLQLLYVGFKLSRLPFQVTVVLGGGVPCFQTLYATLQAVLCHRCGVAVMVGDKPFTGQEVIGTQAHGLDFLAVSAFGIRLLLGFPTLARHYRYDRSMDVRRMLFHVQHSRNGVLLAEYAVKDFWQTGIRTLLELSIRCHRGSCCKLCVSSGLLTA